MTLLATRSAIADRLGAVIGTLAQVGVHGGAFTLAELMRHAKRAPSVWVGCAGLADVKIEASQPMASALWVAAVITKGTSLVKRDAQALALVEAVVSEVPGNVWSQSDVSAPGGIAARNLFSADVDRKGVALWAVSWSQPFDLVINGLADLNDWDTFFATFELPGFTETTPETVDKTTLE